MTKKVKYLLRLDEDIKLYTARQARLNDRSLNQEINSRLRLLKLFDDYCANHLQDNMDSSNSKLQLLSNILSGHSIQKPSELKSINSSNNYHNNIELNRKAAS